MEIYPVFVLVERGTAAGQIMFWDGNKWVHTETSELFWDDTNKRLGIKQSVPTSTLDVNETVTVKRLLAGGVTEI
jgi:hypothetical protein